MASQQQLKKMQEPMKKNVKSKLKRCCRYSNTKQTNVLMKREYVCILVQKLVFPDVSLYLLE